MSATLYTCDAQHPAAHHTSLKLHTPQNKTSQNKVSRAHPEHVRGQIRRDMSYVHCCRHRYQLVPRTGPRPRRRIRCYHTTSNVSVVRCVQAAERTCVSEPRGWNPHFSSTEALTMSGVMMGVNPYLPTCAVIDGRSQGRVHDMVWHHNRSTCVWPGADRGPAQAHTLNS